MPFCSFIYLTLFLRRYEFTSSVLYIVRCYGKRSSTRQVCENKTAVEKKTTPPKLNVTSRRRIDEVSLDPIDSIDGDR